MKIPKIFNIENLFFLANLGFFIYNYSITNEFVQLQYLFNKAYVDNPMLFVLNPFPLDNPVGVFILPISYVFFGLCFLLLLLRFEQLISPFFGNIDLKNRIKEVLK